MGASSEIRAGSAYVELMTRDSKLVKGLARAQKRLTDWGKAVTAAGTKVLAIGTAAYTPLIASGKVFANIGSALVDMSQRTGISIEALSELGHAAKMSGTDMESLEGGTRKMQKLLVAAAGGSQEARETLLDLGLTVQGLGSMTPDQQLGAFADALSQIKDPAVRAARAMAVFGKTGTGLLPLFADGSQGMDELRQQARDLGLTWDTETAQGAEAFGDAIDTAWEVVKKISSEIGGALLPDLKQLTGIVTDAATKVIFWVKANQDLIRTVARITVGVMAAGAALVSLGTIMSGIGTVFGAALSILAGAGAVFGAIGSAVAFLVSPLGLVIAAVVGLGGYFLYASGAAGAAFDFIKGALDGLVSDAKTAFGAIGQALAGGNIALAAQILWLTLKLEWQKGIAFLNAAWQGWKAYYLNVANEAVSGILQILTSSWAGVQTAWVETINFLADAWTLFTSTLTQTWNTAIGFIQKAWVKFKSLFDSDINVNAETTAIDADTKGKNAKVANDRDQKIVGRDQARRQREKQIEADRAGASAIIEADRRKEEQRIIDAQKGATKAGSAELDQARKDWEAAIDEATQTAPAAAGPKKPKPPDLPNGEELLGLAKDKIDVAGTFNAASVGGLGVDATQSRIAKAVESIDKKTRKDQPDAAFT